jgi:tetratricopeptide (TPR) repeat protein
MQLAEQHHFKDLSDWACLQKHLLSPNTDDVEFLYKVCVAASYSGESLESEKVLHAHFQKLLDARRLIAQGQFQSAEELLLSTKINENEMSLLAGDYNCLLANIYFLKGDKDKAQKWYLTAIQIYENCHERHRQLRAKINLEILISDVAEYKQGRLYAIELLASKYEFYDLVGNIQKARAIELTKAMEFRAALTQAQLACESYQFDGFPEDREVALAIAAICAFAIGDLKLATHMYSQILNRRGKSLVYLEVYESLSAGRVPKLQTHHPLSSVNWKSLINKPEQLDTKLLNSLRNRPASREELIAILWPNEIWSESHIRRLHTLVHKIRSKNKILIEYDGHNYILP